MSKNIGVGLIGLGTVGNGVHKIIVSPNGRNPLVSRLSVSKIAVKDIEKQRENSVPLSKLTTDPYEVVKDESVDIVVEMIGGLEPARSIILEAIKNGKSVVTANKAVIARFGQEISLAAKEKGVYVLSEASVGGGIPIIEPLKQSLGANKINKVSGIINGTTNYILSQMASKGVGYENALKEAQNLGYAEANPSSDVEGLDAADKISILSSLAFGGSINRSLINTIGIDKLKSKDMDFASKLGYTIKLLAQAENINNQDQNTQSISLGIWVEPTLIPNEHPLASVNDVFNAILVEGDPIGEVMFYGPGAGAGPTASAVVADILNIASLMNSEKKRDLDFLLSYSSWRQCKILDPTNIKQKNYIRLITEDSPGVIGKIGSLFGENNVSIESIVQFDLTNNLAEIVVITHEVTRGNIEKSLDKIKNLSEVNSLESRMGCL